MDITDRVANAPRNQFDYYAVAKMGLTAVALAVLFIGAIKIIEGLHRRTFTVLQKNLGGTVLTIIYFVAAIRFFGPFTKKTELPFSDEERSISESTVESPDVHVDPLSDEERQSGIPAQLTIRDESDFNGSIGEEGSFEFVGSSDISTSSLEKEFEPVSISDLSGLTMSVIPANYDEKIHGMNGDLMKQKLFEALFNEYIRLLQKEFGINAEQALEELKQKKIRIEGELPSEEQLLYNLLHYLTKDTSEVIPTGSNLFDKIFEMISPGPEETRYWKFIEAHQALLAHDQEDMEMPYDRKKITIGRSLAYIRMFPHIQFYQESFIRAHYANLPKMTAKTFHHDFARRNEGIRNTDVSMRLGKFRSQKNKLEGALSYCSYFGVNPPNLRKIEVWQNKEGHNREIFYLRHATPHAGAAVRQSPIDPIYQEFLRCAENKREGVLYAVHQRLDDYGMKVEQEGYRVQSILDLEKSHSNLLILCQSVESELFKNGKKTFEELKKAMIDSFKQKSGACRNRLPICLVEDKDEETLTINREYENKLREILDFVHHTFFGKKREDISRERVDYYGNIVDEKYLTTEYRAFIMLFYHFQREHLKFADLSKVDYEFTIKFVNSGCKDNFDRGGGQNLTSDRVHHHQVYGADVPSDDLEASATSIQSPPIQSKGIPVIHYRIHPALHVSNLLANLKPSRLQELQTIPWNNGWCLKSYNVGRIEEQISV